MTLIKWTPRANMFNLYNSLDEMIHSFLPDNTFNRSESFAFSPSINVSENRSEYCMSVDVPGVNKKDIQITIEDGWLNISGERKIADINKDSNQLCSELDYGEFSRSLKIPSDIVEDDVVAKYNNGVLCIILPKSKKDTTIAKKIAIS
tara:strand:+ start:868 stop:1311 length:444 start_codon:yes stop_codon:yes gene_type:complete